jgi:hypothetical protein
VIRWAADLRFNAPAAGDYYPFEAGFLARSTEHPEQILRDCDAFNRLRKNHIAPHGIDRTWLQEGDETFVKQP